MQLSSKFFVIRKSKEQTVQFLCFVKIGRIKVVENVRYHHSSLPGTRIPFARKLLSLAIL